MILHFFLWVKDGNGTWRCSNGILKQKFSDYKRVDLNHVLTDTSLFSTKLRSLYAQCMHFPSSA